ncbi:MAG: hypothetical protein AAGF87_10755 [Bacteroidota bacterium]
MYSRFFLFAIRFRRWITQIKICRPSKGSWWSDHILLSLDMLMVFDLYECSSNLLARNTRRLRPAEVQILQTVYGDSLPYHWIRIDEYARLGPRQGQFCYVSFHTINSWGPMSDALLVHEAMHVFQYVHRGAAYIGHAVRAWHTEMGYNYGGGELLRKRDSIWDFNYEQQADIMADAHRLLNGQLPRWYDGSNAWSDYQPYLEEVRAAQMHWVYAQKKPS